MKQLATGKDYESMDVKELFKLFSEDKNNMELRNILIEKQLYVAKIISRKFSNKGVDYEDIFQVASLALIYAIDRYDIARGFEFSSFATPTIEGEIKKYFRDKVWTLRVPRRIQELSKKISNAKIFLEQEERRSPTPQRIAQYLDITEEEVLEAMEASYGYQPISLDMPSNDDSEEKEMTIGDRVGVEEKEFFDIEIRDFMSKFMEELNETESKLIKGRFFENKTQLTLSQELGVSQMTISRLEKKILSKLKNEYLKENSY